MGKPRIVVIDPSGEGRASVATVLRYRRWDGIEVGLTDAVAVAQYADVVLAIEDGQRHGLKVLRDIEMAGHSAARILVCSAREAASVIARGEPAHQVVALPASGDKVVAAIKRSLGVRELIEDPLVCGVARGMSSIPSLPDTWLRLNEIMQSDTADMQEAAAIVECDVGLASKVLQLVNTGLYASDRPVGSIRIAVQRLGLAMVRDLVLAVELFDDAALSNLEDVFGPGPLFVTSHLVGMMARTVAPRTAVDTAFSAGLLHQLGRLAFATRAPERFREAVEASRTGLGIQVCEVQTFGVDSRTLGAWLLATWGLPHEVVDAVRHCDAPERATGRGAPLALSVYLAARLVREAATEVLDNEQIKLVTRAELAPWGLTDSLDEWRQNARTLVEHSALGDGSTPPFVST